MKRCANYVILLAIACTGLAWGVPATNWISLDGASRPAVPTDPLSLTDNTDDGLSAVCRIGGIESVDLSTPMGAFTRISIPGAGSSQRIGEPSLPVLRRIIAVPLGAEVTAEVLRSTSQEIRLSDYGITHPLMPVQRSVSKSESPENVSFAYDAAVYSAAGYDERLLAHVEELGILRGMRLFLLVVEPVKYDPTSQTIQVYNDLSVRVSFAGGDRAATRELRLRTASPVFEALYAQEIWNYRRDSSLDDDLTRYPIKYVIISSPTFTAQLQPFIRWKTEQGYEVIVGYTNDPQVGSTTTSIKAYLQGLYNAGTPEDPAPTFVVFVGDVAQVPAWSGTTGTHPTDLHYVRLSGTDYMPEMYYGRFSANNTTELQPQIDKTLEYERYLMPDPAYLGRVVMIAGVDATYGQVWANGQINYGTTYYFNPAHNITSNTYLYPASGSQDAQIIANASDGRGYMNYTAHGSPTGWADPTFTITDVNGLTNAHKYGTVVGNCCLTNKFDETTCFGEAWLRNANKGAIGYIGGTNSTYWDEDYWWGVGYRASVVEHPTYSATALGAYDGMFHDHAETFIHWYTVQYAFIMAGNLAVVQSGSGMINYYWEVYSLMGDPSLSTFFAVPSANTVSYPDPVLIGQTTMTVTAEPYSYVGFSRDGVLLASGLVGTGGSIDLTFDAFTTPGYAPIVITRQNRIPVRDSIQVIANAGPYLVTENEQFSDAAPGGDGDGLADFGETLGISLTEHNVGTDPASNVMVTISTADPYLTITDSTESFGTINAGDLVTRTNGFAATVAGDVPDGRSLTIDIAACDDQAHEWDDSFVITAHAPLLRVASVAVNDAAGNNNGVLDPGETADLTVTLANGGSAAAVAVVGVLSTDYEDVTVLQATGTLALLNPSQSGPLSAYSVALGSSAPAMDRVFFYLAIDASGLPTRYLLFELPTGGFAESVENGQGLWTHAANQAGWADQWHIETVRSHSPTHSWKCGAVGDTTTAYANHMDAVLVTPPITVSAPSELRFWHQIAAEVSGTYSDSAYDGGIVEISANGGAWTQLIPTVNGYNKWIRCTAGGGNPYTGPFGCRTRCFSGAISWSEVVCDLSAYSGTVQIRFHFGSDNGTGREGWYVDDVRVSLMAGNNPPQNLAATLVGSHAHLAWESPSSGAALATLLGYNIYRNAARADSLVQALFYDDELSGLPYGTYTYAVSAVYSNGESGRSNEASVEWSMSPPDAVTDLTISSSGSDIVLRWSATNNATEYHIYSSDDPTTFEDTPIVTTATTDTLVGEAETFVKHFYMVKAAR